MLRCGDGSIYTGIATDVCRRLAEHAAGTGSRYLRGRGPLRLLLVRQMGDRSLATRVEYRIKRLGRREKEALLGNPERVDALAAIAAGKARPAGRKAAG